MEQTFIYIYVNKYVVVPKVQISIIQYKINDDKVEILNKTFQYLPEMTTKTQYFRKLRKGNRKFCYGSE